MVPVHSPLTSVGSPASCCGGEAKRAMASIAPMLSSGQRLKDMSPAVTSSATASHSACGSSCPPVSMPLTSAGAARPCQPPSIQAW